MVTYEEAIAAAGRVAAEANRLLLTLPLREAAEGAYTPGGPSVEELERRIRDIRAGVR